MANTTKRSRKSQSTSTKEANVKQPKKLSKTAQLVKDTDFRAEAAQVVRHAKTKRQAMVQLAKVAAVTFQRCTKLSKQNADMFSALWRKFSKTVVATASVLSPDTANNLSSELSQLKRLMEWKPVYVKKFADGHYDEMFTMKVGKKTVKVNGTLTDVKLITKSKQTFSSDKVVKLVIGMCKSRKPRVKEVVGGLQTWLRA